MITPTPRAISPQDIVRIYVPPAPPEEQQQLQKQQQKKQYTFSTKESQPNNITIADTNSISRNLNNNKVYSSNNSLSGNGKIQQQQQQQISPTHQTRPTISGLEYESNRNSIIYGSGDLTPVHYTFNRDDELIKSFGDAMLNSDSGYGKAYGGSTTVTTSATTNDDIDSKHFTYQHSSSSSRRGSLSRKSPINSAMFESNVLMECSHMIKRRLSNQSNTSINFEIRTSRSNMSSTENITITEQMGNDYPSLQSARRNSTSNGESPRILTSFEQLAASRQKEQKAAAAEQNWPTNSAMKPTRNDHDDISNNRQYLYDENYSPDDDENYSYSYYNSYKSAESRQRKSPGTVSNSKRFVSESNIQYESIQRRPSKDGDHPVTNKRRPNSSGNETSPFQYDPFAVPNTHKNTSIKEYKRFYGNSVEDAFDLKPDEEPKKSSDESLSSPNSKSMLNTPVNETIPLLSMSSPLVSPAGFGKMITGPSGGTSSREFSNSIQIAASSPSNISIQSPTKQQVQKIMSPTSVQRPSRIPLMQNNQKIMTKSSPTTIQTPSPLSPNDLNRVLPPVEIISSSNKNASNSLSRKIKSPTSPANGQTFGFSSSGASNRTKKMQSQNNGSIATNSDSNTIRIKVNQNDK